MKKTHGLFGAVTLVITCLLCVACGSVQLHDAKKSEIATGVKTKYAEADVLGTIEVQRQNLAALSTEELRIVRENLRLQRDFALLEIVDNDSPMGQTWVDEVASAIAKLGFAEPAALRAYVQGVTVRRNVRDPQLSRLADNILRATGVVVPPCNKSPPLPPADEFDLPSGLPQVVLDRARNRYGLYLDACKKLLAELVELDRGALPRARARWENAKDELEKRRQAANCATQKVARALRSHNLAVAAQLAAGKRGEELRAAIQIRVDQLAVVLEQASAIAPAVVATQRISGIVALLEAAASERIDLAAGGDPDEELTDAVLLVNGIASLASDVAALVATAKAPSVSNLLIELQHQTVLLEHARTLEGLEQERVDILEAKYVAHSDEAAELLRFHDALCSFGVLAAGGKHPGPDCDSFTVGDDDVTCNISGKTVTDCGLKEPWKDYLKRSLTGAPGREFYKALAALNRLFPIRAGQIENNFRIIDLEHRRNLAAREMALKAWSNLALVPIDQIQAYYASGLKPIEIADVLVKALGLTAITVGVSN